MEVPKYKDLELTQIWQTIIGKLSQICGQIIHTQLQVLPLENTINSQLNQIMHSIIVNKAQKFQFFVQQYHLKSRMQKLAF